VNLDLDVRAVTGLLFGGPTRSLSPEISKDQLIMPIAVEIEKYSDPANF
jgi:hypothetical protein